MTFEEKRPQQIWTSMRAAGAAVSMAVCAAVLIWSGMASPATAQRNPESIAALADTLSRAVVNISTEQPAGREADARGGPGQDRQTPEDLFDEFQERQNRGHGANRVNSLGSGFIIDPKGLIITNNHVVDGAGEIYASLPDGTRLKVVQIVGRDTKADLALLRVAPAKPLPSVSLGDSSKMRAGDWVVAIGNPFGLGGSVTLGIVSAMHRNINAGPYDDFIQTDAAINRGNSGGPLFNMAGEVVGVNTAIISPTGGSIGIGFAMPSNTVAHVVDQFRKYGKVQRGWLGVRFQNLGDEIASGIGLAPKSGAVIAGVTPNGPGARAGLQTGDVVISYDGQDVNGARGLPRLVADTEAGKTVDIAIWRNGERKIVKARVEKLDETVPVAAKRRAPEPKPVAQQHMLGLALAAMSDELRSRFHIDKSLSGVVVTGVDAASLADEQSIKPGDVILEVTSEKVRTPGDIMKRVRDLRAMKRKTALLLVAGRKGETNFVAVRIAE